MQRQGGKLRKLRQERRVYVNWKVAPEYVQSTQMRNAAVEETEEWKKHMLPRGVKVRVVLSLGVHGYRHLVRSRQVLRCLIGIQQSRGEDFIGPTVHDHRRCKEGVPAGRKPSATHSSG